MGWFFQPTTHLTSLNFDNHTNINHQDGGTEWNIHQNRFA